MALWGFSRESTQPYHGANTEAGIRKGYRPLPVASGAEEPNESGNIQFANKRNVIATQAGWVRRINKTKTEAPTVNIQVDEVLVAAHPGSGFSYTANTYLGNPDIVEIFVKPNANGVLSANVSSNLYVVFNMPVHLRASSNALTIRLANTSPGGNTAVARIQASAAARANVANNVLVFTIINPQGAKNGTGLNRCTYQVNAQFITVTGGGNPIYNPEAGSNPTKHAANLQITGAVSNNLSNGWGSRTSTFIVSARGL
jgi:hypothetical protein